MTTMTPVAVPVNGVVLTGDLTVPPSAQGIVLFAHGSGSSRMSPRNRSVAAQLNTRGFATVLLDLLTRAEEAMDTVTGEFRFDVELLAHRLEGAMDWVTRQPELRALPMGVFGASTGAAAALIAAAQRPSQVHAVVSRGGRPDMAGTILGRVTTPTLLIVGGRDRTVLDLNRSAQDALGATAQIVVVPGATHLFEEAGALDRVADLAGDWFERCLRRDLSGPAG